MSKQAFTPQRAWETLLAEERTLRRTVPRLKVAEPVVSALFLLITWFFGLMSYYSLLLVNFMDDPSQPVAQIPGLWELCQQAIFGDEDPELMIMLLFVGAYPVAFVACVVVGLLLKLVIWPSKPAPEANLPQDKLAAWDMVIKKAEQVIALTRPEDRLLRRVNLLICIGAAATLLSAFFTVDVSNPNFAAALVSGILLCGMHLGLSCLTFLFVRLAVLRHEPDSEAETIKGNAMRARSAEEKQCKQDRLTQEKAEKIQKGTALFHEGKYEAANKLLKGVNDSTSGDLAAMKLLTDSKLGSMEGGPELSYKLLWDAKELGFRDAQIRQAVDRALEQIKPLVMERSQAQLLDAYASFLGKHYSSVIYKCKPLVEFGHPDALALTVVCHILTDNDPDRYPAWLELLKKAKRRGFDPLYEEIVEETITDLENAIRYKEWDEKERLNRMANEIFVDPVHDIPTWAEPSGWYDFRTGETLYRIDGRIVNGNGEEVSAAWWC